MFVNVSDLRDKQASANKYLFVIVCGIKNRIVYILVHKTSHVSVSWMLRQQNHS